MLALPRQTGRNTVNTGACNKQTGCDAVQDYPEDSAKPDDYFSPYFNKRENAYETTHQKCLPVLWAVLLLVQYSEGSPFTVHTDQKALRWIVCMMEATGKLNYWLLRLTEFKFDVMYRASVRKVKEGRTFTFYNNLQYATK